MALAGVDIVSVDWTVDLAEARTRLGANIGVQKNLDPCVLFGSKEFIRDASAKRLAVSPRSGWHRIYDTVRKAGNVGHILNLGHGVLPSTPEENVAFFFETAKQLKR